MKFLMPLLMFVLFVGGCGKKEEKQTPVQFEEVVAELIEGKTPKNVSQTLLDEAQALITRSENNGYGLMSTKELYETLEKQAPIVIVSASSRGEYMLGLIPNAKNFGFSLQGVQANGELEWDSKGESQEMFQKKLGEDKGALIVFYDGGNTPPYQMGSADLACLWAKKLGYTNIYRLVGGFKAWKEQGYKVTQELPSCCEM